MTQLGSVEQAERILETSPAWSDARSADSGSRRRIVAALDSLSRFDLDTLRAAVSHIVSSSQARNAFDVATMSRLYVLDRHRFAVPERVPIGAPRFGSFQGMPRQGDTLNEMWPLSFDGHGHLILTGDYQGYSGEDFQALSEFDDFRTRYGPRHEQEGR